MNYREIDKKANKFPLISVIVPVYNTEDYLARCLNTIINQTYKNIEIILVNDGSTDNSLKICKKFEKENENVIVIDKQNGGLGSARNAGINASSGSYLSFIDSDDWIKEDMFEYMISLLNNYNADVVDIKITQTDLFEEFKEKATEKIEIYKEDEILEYYMYRGLSETNGAPYSVCRKLYRKSLFVGDTAHFTEGTLNEDICFNFNILRKANILIESNQTKYFYFQGIESITNGALQNKDLDLLKVSEELLKLSLSTSNNNVIKYAEIKKARSYFSLLARIAKYGVSEEIENEDKLVSKLLEKLKENMKLLLFSPIPLSRKVLAIFFIINFNFSKNIIRFLK